MQDKVLDIRKVFSEKYKGEEEGTEEETGQFSYYYPNIDNYEVLIKVEYHSLDKKESTMIIRTIEGDKKSEESGYTESFATYKGKIADFNIETID